VAHVGRDVLVARDALTGDDVHTQEALVRDLSRCAVDRQVQVGEAAGDAVVLEVRVVALLSLVLQGEELAPASVIRGEDVADAAHSGPAGGDQDAVGSVFLGAWGCEVPLLDLVAQDLGGGCLGLL
jgi:hypothetical protein